MILSEFCKEDNVIYTNYISSICKKKYFNI